MIPSGRTIVLAKRPRSPVEPDEEASLRYHSACCCEAFDTLFGRETTPTRLCREWLRFFQLSDIDPASFLTNGRVSCALHDVGKANTGFAALLRGHHVQALRHEQVSGLLLALRAVREWLSGIPRLDCECVMCAVIGHHLQADRRDFGRPAADMQLFRLLPDGVHDVLDVLRQRFALPMVPTVSIPQIWRFDGGSESFSPSRHAEEVRQSLEALDRRWRKEPLGPGHRLTSAVRAALIVADAAASGLVRESHSLSHWLGAAFGDDYLVDVAAIDEKVIRPRTEQISRRQRKAFKWLSFQNAAESLPDRTLILQSCGSGKTLAAWRWIRGRLANRPVSRVIFLYPTRGTATEGFRDYVSWAPEADAALVQATAAYDLQGVMENISENDARRGRDYSTEDRLFALGYWQRRIFSATVDQFLGFMQNQYRSVCLLPLLVDSVVVIDEVHSFDRNLFASLKAFLRTFDVPVLCMTASLTPARRRDLIECGLAVFPQDMAVYADLAARAAMPRYEVRRLASAESAEGKATEAVSAGKRVLWVVNTVERCQELARKHGALCYHSRFKLEDRRRCHGAVVDAFQPGPQGRGVLAVTTQVCEMSLDLDADMLVSEAAPVPSMIQRLGRCNRHGSPGDGRVGQALFYLPENPAPYRREEMANVDDFLAAVDCQTCSQATLDDLLERYGSAEYEPERYTAFINDGPWAVTRELRDASDFAESAILDADVEAYLALRSSHRVTDGLPLSVPKGCAATDARLPRHLRVAPAANYHRLYGFCKQPVEGSA